MERDRLQFNRGMGRSQTNMIRGFQSRILLEDLHDQLCGALIGLARVCASNPASDQTGQILLTGLEVLSEADHSSVGWVEVDDPRVVALQKLIQRVHDDKYTISPDCMTCQTPCGNTSDYDLNVMRLGDAGMFGHKLHILRICKEIAEIFAREGYSFPDPLRDYLLKALYSIAEEWEDEFFVQIINEGEAYLTKLRL